MPIDVLAVGAHPDDVDMSAGGTVAKLAARGRSVAILDLTRGEMGSRGSAETRAKEAQAAAKVLGVKERIGLDMGDGVLEATLENRRKLIEVVRDLRPAIVLGPYWDDLHPDHAAAGRLLCGVMYPSGFARYPAKGDPFRPNEYLFYMGHTLFLPALIVDVGGFFERKLEAVRCFDSQVNPGREDGPATGISRPEFLPALEGRARHYGRQIGREFGEPFTVRRPVPMDDPVAHYLPFTKIHAGKERVT